MLTRLWTNRNVCSTFCVKTFSTSGIAQSGIIGNSVPKWRLNRCFPLLSRREADKVIKSNRVKINGKVATVLTDINEGDVLEMDGKVINWEDHKANTLKPLSKGIDNSKNVYIKLWKSKGTNCTTDLSDPENIFASTNILEKVTQYRLFPVGRLDKHTTGLVLLTSDTRLMSGLLGAANKQPKVYQVKLHKNISDEDIKRISEGIEITTETTTGKVITAKTLPCDIKRIPSISMDGGVEQKPFKNLEFSSIAMRIVEGRNRQIRKMVEALGYKVLALHRTRFCGLQLTGLKEPTDWCTLSKNELALISKIGAEARVQAAKDRYNNAVDRNEGVQEVD